MSGPGTRREYRLRAERDALEDRRPERGEGETAADAEADAALARLLDTLDSPARGAVIYMLLTR